MKMYVTKKYSMNIILPLKDADIDIKEDIVHDLVLIKKGVFFNKRYVDAFSPESTTQQATVCPSATQYTRDSQTAM